MSTQIDTFPSRSIPAMGANALTTACVPACAALGDDDVMSTPCQSISIDEDVMAVRWRERIWMAQLTWRWLTLAELSSVNGVEHQLASLLHQRYALSRGLADCQAREFFSKQMA